MLWVMKFFCLSMGGFLNMSHFVFAGTCQSASMVFHVGFVVGMILGVGASICNAYAFRLKPRGEYARMESGMVSGECPEIAVGLERGFAT